MAKVQLVKPKGRAIGSLKQEVMAELKAGFSVAQFVETMNKKAKERQWDYVIDDVKAEKMLKEKTARKHKAQAGNGGVDLLAFAEKVKAAGGINTLRDAIEDLGDLVDLCGSVDQIKDNLEKLEKIKEIDY